MQKLETLREALAEALPELKRNPENLRIRIERGSARCQGTTTEAFGFAFQANVVIFEMASDNASADVMLQIQLTQNATVTPAQDGGHTIEWLPEPDPLFADGEGLGGTDPVPQLSGVDIAEDVPPWNP